MVLAIAFCSTAATKPFTAELREKVHPWMRELFPVFCTMAPASPALRPPVKLRRVETLGFRVRRQSISLFSVCFFFRICGCLVLLT